MTITQEMAAVCCYFNPCHYQSRLRNYRAFRENVTRSGVELLTVELTFGDGEFELAGFPNTILLRGPDVMWQKERLLNIGLAELIRRGYSKLAWFDADIMFHEPRDWADRASRMLDHFPVVQLYDRVTRAQRDGRSVGSIPGSVIHHQQTGVLSNVPGAPGFAWAARSEVLQSVPLYDAAILGGGDSLIFFASYATAGPADLWERVAHVRTLRALSTPVVEHWLSWAARWGAVVRGQVHYVPQGITALYHGRLSNRRYLSRFEILRRHGFDPAHDVVGARGEPWRWATDKPPRRALSQIAIECFLQQTHPQRQLVIVNHSDEPFGLDDRRIKELLVQRPPTLGELRNIGLDAADGDLIVTWDDDDWHAPERIAVQVDGWRATGGAVILGCYLACDVLTGEAYVRSCRHYSCGGCCGVILFPRTDFRYPPLDKGEDTEFAKSFAGIGRLTVLENDPLLYFRTYHGTNTWSRNLIMTRIPGRSRELSAGERAKMREIIDLYVAAGALRSNPMSASA